MTHALRTMESTLHSMLSSRSHEASLLAVSRIHRARTLLRQPVLELVDDVGVAHEGECVVVDAHVHAELDVQPVALRDRRQVRALAPDVQVPPARGMEGRSGCVQCALAKPNRLAGTTEKGDW